MRGPSPDVAWFTGSSGLRNAEAPARVVRGKIGDDGFAREGGLAFGDERPHARRQINIDARAEADHADPLAGADFLAFAHERYDAARDQAGDLHHADAPARARNDQTVALVVLARLVEVGVEELAGLVHDPLDASAD